MRCRACDAELTDAEAVRKYDRVEGQNIPAYKLYVDLCSHCLSLSEVGVDDDITFESDEELSEEQIEEDYNF